MINIKTKLTDEFIGKYAKLKHGFASGLIGIIEKNNTGVGVSSYVHVTKSGIKTGIIFKEDVELV
jgi:hypothetical protein